MPVFAVCLPGVVILLTASILAPVLATKATPGLIFQLTDRGLIFTMGEIAEGLGTKLASTKLKDISGKKVKIYNLKFKEMSPLKLEHKLLPPSSIEISGKLDKITVDGNFRACKKIILKTKCKTGSFNVRLSSINLKLKTSLGKDQKGFPTITAPVCSARIQNVRPHFRAGFLGWIANLFRRKIGKKMKNALQKKLCNVAAKRYASGHIQRRLQSLSLEKKIKGTPLILDYRLVRAPEIRSKLLKMDLKGEVCSAENDHTPLLPKSIESIATENPTGLIRLILTEYLFNSALHHAGTARLLKFRLQKGENKKTNEALRTSCGFFDTCFGKLIPEISQQYPNASTMIIDIEATKPPPLVQFKNGTMDIKGIGILEARALDDYSKQISSIVKTLNISLIVRVKNLNVHNDVLNGTASVEKLDLSGVGDMGRIFLVGKLERQINKLLSKGIKLPSLRGYQPTNPQLTIIDGAIIVDSDLKRKSSHKLLLDMPFRS